MKEIVCVVIGFLGSVIATLFGGWAEGMTVLLILMAIDYVSGLAVAGVFKKSQKTASGALESRAGLKGLCRKGMMILIVIAFHGMDVLIPGSGDTARDGACIALCANELISLVENAGLMGLKLPKFIQNAVDVFAKKAKKEEKEDDENGS